MEPMMAEIGRMLIIAGVLMALVGALLMFGARLPFVGRLPGDFVFQRDGITVYIPLATMVLLSLLLTLIFNLLGRGR